VVTLDLASRKPPGGDGTIPFSVQILAIGEGTRPFQVDWQLEGVVRRAIEVFPPQLDFFEDLVVGTHFAARCVRVRCLEPVSGLRVTCDPALGSASLQRIPGKEAEFELEFVPSDRLRVGPLRGDILVEPLLVGSTDPPVAKVPVCGTVMPELKATPGELLLGPVAVGATVKESVDVSSRTGRRIGVKRVQGRSGCVEVGPASVSPSGVASLVISLSVKDPGPQSAAVVVEVAYEDGTAGQTTIPVRWYGVSRHLAQVP